MRTTVFVIFDRNPDKISIILIPKNYLSPENLGRKFELILATKNLGTNSSKIEQFSTKIFIR